MNVTIKDIEDLTGHITKSISANFKEQMDPVVRRFEAVENRLGGLEVVKTAIITDISRLKANQAKALVGWTVLVTGVTLFINNVKGWAMSHFHV